MSVCYFVYRDDQRSRCLGAAQKGYASAARLLSLEITEVRDSLKSHNAASVLFSCIGREMVSGE